MAREAVKEGERAMGVARMWRERRRVRRVWVRMVGGWVVW